METLSDFPKVQCPFVRKIFPVNKDDFKKYGSQYQLRNPEVYLVTNEVSPGFEWVFDDPDTIAVEKLDGTEFSSPAWLRFLKQLKEQVEHHLDDEEQEFFQIAGRILNEKQKKALGEAYRDEMSELA